MGSNFFFYISHYIYLQRGDGVCINILCGPLQWRFTGWPMVVPGNGVVFQGVGTDLLSLLWIRT